MSLYFCARHGTVALYETILELIAEKEFSNDAVWLLIHLVIDGPINFAKLFRSRLFEKLADQLTCELPTL